MYNHIHLYGQLSDLSDARTASVLSGAFAKSLGGQQVIVPDGIHSLTSNQIRKHERTLQLPFAPLMREMYPRPVSICNS